MTRFNIGDEVRVTDTTSPYYPAVGTVTEVGETKLSSIGPPYIVQLLFDDRKTFYGCEISRRES